MKLLTQPIMHKLLQNGVMAQSDQDPWDPVPVCKLFGGGSCTWLLTEYHPDRDQFFGLCDLGQGCPELGYVSKSELESLRFPPFNLPIERDRWFETKEPISKWLEKSKAQGRIHA